MSLSMQESADNNIQGNLYKADTSLNRTYDQERIALLCGQTILETSL